MEPEIAEVVGKGVARLAGLLVGQHDLGADDDLVFLQVDGHASHEAFRQIEIGHGRFGVGFGVDRFHLVENVRQLVLFHVGQRAGADACRGFCIRDWKRLFQSLIIYIRIGSSGLTEKPNLYVGIAVSGQTQRTMGMYESGKVDGVETTFGDLSPMDIRFCEAMAEHKGSSRLSDVAAHMGVSDSIPRNGRLLDGVMEMLLQGLLCGYEIEAFNKDEVIYIIGRGGLAITCCQELIQAHLYK